MGDLLGYSGFRPVVNGDVKFFGATFRDRAKFFGAVFDIPGGRGATNFSGVVFEQGAIFYAAVFRVVANFGQGKFLAGADFSKAQFHEPVSFGGAELRGEVRFVGDAGNGLFLNRSDFRMCDLEGDGVLVFERVNLSKASFTDTDITSVRFRDVTWCRSKGKLGATRPACLWDEFRLLMADENARDYDKIAENYSQLVQNHESKRDYETAESFHIGELEVRRKRGAQTAGQGRWLRERLNAYWVYKVLSNYGTSYWRAVGWLAAWVVLLAGAMMWAGFSVNDSGGHRISYDLSLISGHNATPIGKLLSDYGTALSFMFSLLTFQRDRHFEPLSDVGRLLVAIATVLFASQSALILLAIRRRFRR